MSESILHRAEEMGQARALTSAEVMAWVKLAAIIGVFWGAPVGVLVICGYLLVDGRALSAVWIALSAIMGWLVFSGAVLGLGMAPNLFSRLSSWRQAETFSPTSEIPEPEQKTWRPPIPLTSGGKRALVSLDDDSAPVMFPDRQDALMISPSLVAQVLRVSVERFNGHWSRRKITAIKIGGRKVTRGQYEQITAGLTQAGFLSQTRQGGFVLPGDIESAQDLVKYFPSLPLGGPGGGSGRAGHGGADHVAQAQGGVVENLARRRVQRWVECGHDVQAYRGGSEPNGLQALRDLLALAREWRNPLRHALIALLTKRIENLEAAANE